MKLIALIKVGGVGIGLRVLWNDLQLFRRDVAFEDDGGTGSWRIVQFLVGHEGAAAGKIAQAHAKLVFFAVLQLDVFGKDRLIEISLLIGTGRNIGVVVTSGIGQRAALVQLSSLRIRQHEGGPILLLAVT